MKTGITYFAYGANLDLKGMGRRANGCEQISRATLPDYRLVFRGVADIEPAAGEKVRGALYRITLEHLRALDSFEGYPQLYIRKEVLAVPDNGDPIMATIYQMTNRKGYSPPYVSYLETILSGCRDWGIEEEYIRQVIKTAAESHFGER